MNQDDNSIPLLTEVIPTGPSQPLPQQDFQQTYLAPPPNTDYGVPPYPGAFHTPPDASSYQAPLPQFHPAPAAPQTLSFTPADAAQWEQDIRENVLQRLLGQADTVLQQHLHDQLAVALDNIADIVTQRVKESLRQALAETVTRAVAEEMARFTASNK